MLLSTPPPSLQQGGVTVLSSGLLANAVFTVLTPEPCALGMETAIGSVPGQRVEWGRDDSSVVVPCGLISLCWVGTTHLWSPVISLVTCYF